MLNKGFNDVPIESLCPNAQHLLRIANGNDLSEIKGSVDAASELEFYIYPFSEKQTTVVHASATEDDPTFGFEMETDELHKHVYISNALKKSTASSIYKSKNDFRINLKGAFLTHINDIPVSSKSNAVERFKLLKDGEVK